MNLWLVAALVCGLGLGVTSCKDDDDENNSSNERVEVDATETEEAQAALRWLCALTETNKLADNWASRTYEPTVGQASAQNELCRVVVVTDLDEAKMKFAALAAVSPDELGTAKTVSDPGVGTLTWTPSASGADNLSTVDVQSPLLPRLRQIVYCTEDQMGKNGWVFKNVKGTAYYRFGDVVMKDGYFWVCVRPCFEQGDKGTSHWINIFNATPRGGNKQIPDENLQFKWNQQKAYEGATIVLPTKLAMDRQHLYNLARLIWALKDPDGYGKAVKQGGAQALGGFDYDYNGQKFVEKVANNWSNYGVSGVNIWKLLFSIDREDIEETDRLEFFYKGYSWAWGYDITLYKYVSDGFAPKYTGDEKKDKMTVDARHGFDIRLYTGSDDAMANEKMPQFSWVTENDKMKEIGRWVVRYATGKQLAGSDFSPYERMDNCQDIYVYNILAKKAVKSALEKESDL